LAADGQSVVASIYNRGVNDRDIWLLDTRRGVRTRVTSGPEDDSDPLLSPDGSRLAYSSRNGLLKRLVIRSTGATNASVLVEDTWNKYASTWTADGRSVLYSHFTGPRGFDIAAATSGSSPVPVLATSASESRSRLSPDGRFIAYQSSESGRPEIYLATYPDGQQKWPVSSGGGADPEWGPDGSALYFVTATALVQAPVVSKGGTLEIGTVEPIVDLRRLLPGLAGLLTGPSNIFDAAPDGQRFLFNIPEQSAPEPATLIVNWPEFIRRGK
jgi:Tol biopolymer transport system component